jgi:hypothetical protein
MNRAGKHHLIQLASVVAARIEARRVTLRDDPNDRTYAPMVGNIVIKHGVPFKGGAKIGRMETLDTRRNVEMETAIAAEVVFLQGCKAVQRFPVIAVLDGAADVVSGVLEMFRREFVS